MQRMRLPVLLSVVLLLPQPNDVNLDTTTTVCAAEEDINDDTNNDDNLRNSNKCCDCDC